MPHPTLVRPPAPPLTAPPGFQGVFRTDDEARAVYAEAAGIGRTVPRGVAVPADADDVVRLVRWAAEHALGLVPRGSGSSMSGGAIGDGVVVDLSRLDGVGEVDARRARVWVGPGALRGAVDRAARAAGLAFPVDPSSGAFCTVGGMVACNAAGAHSLKYGAMRAWVSALDCVFADGSRAVVRRGAPPPNVPPVRRFLDDAHPTVVAHGPAARRAVRKEASGYGVADYAASRDLVDLLVGSEGTLAIFVCVELALAPLPGATSSVLAAFPSLEGAVEGAGRARELGAAACELLDRTFVAVAAEGNPALAAGALGAAESLVLAELEADDAPGARAAAQRVASAFAAAGASEVRVALDAAAEHALWAVRHAASPILARLDPSLKSMQFIEDGAVPPERLAEYVRGVRAALDRRGIRGVIFGHAGDAHVHVNPLVDVRLPDWRERVTALLDEVTDLVARLGGTLTGEHGDGRLRTPLLDRVWDDAARALFAVVKLAFDPAGVLNPGVKVPIPGQPPVADVKYDPSLPPLPPAARRALDHVADARAYARHRLELLEDVGSAEPGAGAGARHTADTG
jgi:FAD/FMN-containing dehydrogenase